ncbi:hypothetical protein [Telluribacter sp. SYSU D00476]|uniref:hypothetical protein n=1 Tax=Telluribacter sp. SYSU D00476 TaxID=2811430 RepID=UPI001FF3CEA7|nr:hypothetical protein [Telluribacter sp. SYSU D00476]
MTIHKAFDAEKARNQLVELLDKFIAHSTTTDFRTKVQKLIPAFMLLRKIGISIIDSHTEYSARERILLYFRKNPMTIIETEELMVVSGISEYPRRIRELRVQEGWPILSGKTVKSMQGANEWDNNSLDVNRIKPDEYILLKDQQDRDAAYRWKQINQIRREKIAVQDKIIKYLLLIDA